MREVISNRLASISLRDLSLVEAVAHYRGFRTAAEAMGISASGLSQQIRKVEEALGHRLFERGQKVSLTEQGQIAIDVIRKILVSIADLEPHDQSANRALGRRLRIGTISSLSPADMLCVVRNCEDHSPGTQFEMISGKHHGLLRRLMDREIDILITAEPAVPDNCQSADIFSENFALISHHNSGGQFFLSSEDDFIPSEILARFKDYPPSCLKRAYGMGIEQRIAFVIAGYGATLVPMHWINCQPLTKMLKVTPLSGTRKVRAIWRHSYALRDEIAAIWAAR